MFQKLNLSLTGPSGPGFLASYPGPERPGNRLADAAKWLSVCGRRKNFTGVPPLIKKQTLGSIEKIDEYFGHRLILQRRTAAYEEVLISREKVSNFKKWMEK